MTIVPIADPTAASQSPLQPRVALRRARRLSSGRPPTQPLTTIGENGVVFVVLVGVAIQGYRFVLRLIDRYPATPGVVPGFLVLGALLSVALTSLTVVGPLASSKPFSDLLLSTAANRGHVLRRRFLYLTFTAFLTAYGLTWLAASTPWTAVAALTAVLVGCTSTIVVATAVVVQASSVAGGRIVRWSSALGCLLSVAAAIDAHHSLSLSMPGGADTTKWLLTFAAACMALTICAVAWSRLRHITRRALDDSGSAMVALGASVQWMDGSLLFGVVEDRWWRKVGRVRSLKLRCSNSFALLRLDIARPWRRPSWLVAWCTVCAGAHALWFGVSPLLGLFAAVGVGYIAVSPFARGLRQLHASAGLRRLLAHSDGHLYRVHYVVPILASISWAALVWLVLPITIGIAVLIAAGLAGSAIRAATRPQVDFGGPVVDSPFGLIPISLITSVTRGLDLWLATVVLVVALASATVLA